MVTMQTPKCVMCGKTSTVELTTEEATKWLDPSRPHVQDVFPHWSADKRELLVTGTHAECWDELMEDFSDKDIDDDV